MTQSSCLSQSAENSQQPPGGRKMILHVRNLFINNSCPWSEKRQICSRCGPILLLADNSGQKILGASARATRGNSTRRPPRIFLKCVRSPRLLYAEWFASHAAKDKGHHCAGSIGIVRPFVPRPVSICGFNPGEFATPRVGDFINGGGSFNRSPGRAGPGRGRRRGANGARA